jgi:ankyrin repeat protein
LLQAKTEVDIRKIPEERDLDTGWSKALGGYPIHIAIERSSYACLEALFKDATDAAGLLRLKDERGNTPLHVATGLSFLATMFLLEKGADLSIFNSAHHTPLGYAIRMRSADGEKDSVDVSDAIIELIINHGGSSVCQIPDGEIDRTPIHVICQRPHRVGGAARILRWMLAEGTSVDIADSQGRTPLHLACGPLNRHCHSSVEGEAAVMVQALLEAGADPNIVDSSGMTPLALAVINASLPVIKLLTKPQVRAPLKATLCDGKNLECASFFGRRQASGDSKEVLSLLLGKEVSRATLQVWKEKAEKEKAFWTRWVYYS